MIDIPFIAAARLKLELNGGPSKASADAVNHNMEMPKTGFGYDQVTLYRT